MISFRYHLVSLVAVFLALALGIVVGTTALNGPITTDLRNQVNTLKSDRGALAQQVKTLQGQVSDAGQFATSFGAQIVNGSLAKQNVLMIGLPGAIGSVQDGIAKEIAAAGGKVSGQVQLTAAYVDQRRGSDIIALATGAVHPPGLTLPQGTADPGQIGGALLAYVLLGQGLPTDLTQVIGGFSELHMVSASASLVASTTIVVVGTGAMRVGDYAARSELAFVTALQQRGGHVVVAGDPSSATLAGIVAGVRGAAGDKTTISTIDNADGAIGQISTVLALADITNSSVGHYGTGKGADSLFPTPTK
ncbi:MAG: copper transporter [Actinomycetota bacterium]|nr:copper transporter [Actinomycetota bacterium]